MGEEVHKEKNQQFFQNISQNKLNERYLSKKMQKYSETNIIDFANKRSRKTSWNIKYRNNVTIAFVVK
jgi:hypothetical protein